ncbi:MAG: hypothetical protein RLZZ403_242 [Pseudomonadota bacterium]|jgi:hypothetical protein
MDYGAYKARMEYEAAKAQFLAEARHEAKLIAKRKGRVTVDDVREKWPPPSSLDPRIMGAIFAGKEWKRVDYIVGTRGASHKRPIAVFIRADMEK